jgi:hypothetical protein
VSRSFRSSESATKRQQWEGTKYGVALS